MFLMKNINKSKVSLFYYTLNFSRNGLICFHCFLYFINFSATILEGVSIISLIPLIQSVQSLNLENNEIAGHNLYLYD